MIPATSRAAQCFALLILMVPLQSALALDSELLESVVSVLPLWPGQSQGGSPNIPPGAAPEGSAVAIAAGGYLITALHVVDQALSIEVRLSDGRLAPAEIVGRDGPTDLAVFKIEEELPLLPDAPLPDLGAPVCAIGNQFGLGLSVTCGVVSATRRSGVGFNPIEDFIQTDATVNPGASGGALIDAEGRLVGILSAIFTKESDADIGVNFAVSIALARRIGDDLIAHGRVIRSRSGFRVADLDRQQRYETTGVNVTAVLPDGPAARAGLREGDLVQTIAGRPIRRASDVTAAVQLHRPGETMVITGLRDGVPISLDLVLSQ